MSRGVESGDSGCLRTDDMVQCCSLASNKESLIQVSRTVLYTWMGGGGGVM